MGMYKNLEECPICKGINIKNNTNSAVDSYEFFCKDCTGQYYLILSSTELGSFNAIILSYKDNLLNIFNNNNHKLENKYPIFDYHRPITFKEIQYLLNS